MSGHSKWHSIKHKKAKEDAKRGNIFGKLSRNIIVAVREGGGGDPKDNITLANAIAKAKVQPPSIKEIVKADYRDKRAA